MDVWRREAAAARESVPPPAGPRRPPPRLVPSRTSVLSASAAGLSALAGAILGGLVTLAYGWPPGDGLFVALAGVGVAVGGVEYARTRRAATALGHGALAGVGAGLAATIILPVWGLLEFLDCWMSWLSDC